MDFVDTFIDAKHAVESFPNKKIEIVGNDGKSKGVVDLKNLSKLGDKVVPPFKVTFPKSEDQSVIVQSYLPLHPGPYPQNIPKKNAIPFTPKYVFFI